VLKVDGFAGRSLFDLYSNFTFFLNDPIHGDAFQQHDSRLQQGANLQYTHPHKLFGITASFVAGSNFHGNQIDVGLYPRDGRTPAGVTTRAQQRGCPRRGATPRAAAAGSHGYVSGRRIVALRQPLKSFTESFDSPWTLR
jgi:hypothetical protein